jgi:Coenzyme PQQ synthesis protein D (PqqD)
VTSSDPTTEVLARRGKNEIWVLAARSGTGTDSVTAIGLPSWATLGQGPQRVTYGEGHPGGAWIDTFSRVTIRLPTERGLVMGEPRFRVNTPDVMHESIEGEVIIINLVSGNYYSVGGSGTEIWGQVQGREAVSRAEIVDALSALFDGSRSDLEGAVTQFLEELCHEGLVAEVETSDETPRTLQSPRENGRPRRPFDLPMLEKYTDMQDLVLIDPVHQVDDTGWPRKRPEASTHGADA